MCFTGVKERRMVWKAIQPVIDDWNKLQKGLTAKQIGEKPGNGQHGPPIPARLTISKIPKSGIAGAEFGAL